MSIFGYIGLGLFLLFCVAMIWQIHSDMNETSRVIARGYGIANVTHAAQVFEKTGVDLMSDIDHLAIEHMPAKSSKPKQQKSKMDFHFEI